MKCSLQCRRQIFMSLSFFAEKVILELNCTKITCFRASKNTNSVFSANNENVRPQDAQKLLSQWEKVAKCNFKSKAQVHKNYSF